MSDDPDPTHVVIVAYKNSSGMILWKYCYNGEQEARAIADKIPKRHDGSYGAVLTWEEYKKRNK